ncbi:GTP-binding protein YchF [Desulfotomaculum nigrificans CO-1-SRB]|uniref:Ribosome-binding ATPase YchF n=1 Tax=Desulfotomaculum nigrificans (strain DSM 14880 / VKM B-2319 / CO-1-SRB) TaxID=868595 RepID=F6B731_DESCC|nr:redox-regulated ATPase YchF [Desulfotomaculum nigrificans]AEF94456.1 GTP-binding protein YchF [Desulfotomaculum nigrificans CO-1-SRB]
MSTNLTSGIIGLPMVGKTTIFNLLTNSDQEISNFFSGKTETITASAKVPDKRINFLADMYKPRKTTYAQIQFSEVPGLVKGASEGKGVGNQFLSAIRNVDLLVHVVRAFKNPDVPHVEDTINPLRDIETIAVEILLADMDLVEKRIQRIQSGKKITKENAFELEVLKKCLAALEEEVPISSLGLSEEEKLTLRNYAFLTEKPMMLVINIDEDQFREGTYPGKEEVEKYAADRGIALIEICGRMEMEINQLPEEDRALFMEDLGISEPGIDRLARAVYDYLGLISFLTAGEDEVRAWTIKRNTDAKKAAGKIHSDIERGFIRAEVIAFEDLVAAGNMVKAREKGLIRLEGKDYIVQDGDIINFRFNV